MQARLLTTALLASAASLVSAVPVEQVRKLDVRQLASSDDLKDGKCAGNVFIFARGSTEVGNMVCAYPRGVLLLLPLKALEPLSPFLGGVPGSLMIPPG